MSRREPSTNGANGEARDAQGRYMAGNPGGPGNPYARRVARLRSLLLETVTEEDLRQIIEALVRQAKAGDMAAVRELLTRCLGTPDSIGQADPDRVDLHEGHLAEQRAMAEQRKKGADLLWPLG